MERYHISQDEIRRLYGPLQRVSIEPASRLQALASHSPPGSCLSMRSRAYVLGQVTLTTRSKAATAETISLLGRDGWSTGGDLTHGVCRGASRLRTSSGDPQRMPGDSETATGIELRQVQKGLLVAVAESRPVFTPAFPKLLGVLIREIGRNTMGRSCSPGTSM